MSDTSQQVISVKNLNQNNIVFAEFKADKATNTKTQTGRVSISYKYPDGSVGPLLISTLKNRYSFGVSQNKAFDDSKSDQPLGYTLPICLCSRDGATAEEREWVQSFEKLVQFIKEWCVANRKSFKKPTLEISDLKKFGQLYRKKDDDGNPVSEPTMYAKLIENRSKGTVLTKFFEEENRKIVEIQDFKTLIGQGCHVTAVIKFESIFVGTNLSLQYKIHQALVKRVANQTKCLFEVDEQEEEQPAGCLFNKPTADSLMKDMTTTAEDDDSDDGSIDGDEAPPPAPAPKPAEPVRRKVVPLKPKWVVTQ